MLKCQKNKTENETKCFFISSLTTSQSSHRSFGRLVFHRRAVTPIFNILCKVISITSLTELALKLKSNQTINYVKHGQKTSQLLRVLVSLCKRKIYLLCFVPSQTKISSLYRLFFVTIFIVIFFATLYDSMAVNSEDKSKHLKCQETKAKFHTLLLAFLAITLKRHCCLEL